MCKFPEDRRFIEGLVKGWLDAVGLNLKKEKTRWVDMRNESRSHQSKFDFLGFKFHLRSFKDNPKRFWVARQPSQGSRKRLHEALRRRLHSGLNLNQARIALERTWYGWSEYFRYSNANRIFYRERKLVKRIYMRYLVRKYRRQRKAVAWRKLIRWKKTLLRELRTLRVRPNHLFEPQTGFRVRA